MAQVVQLTVVQKNQYAVPSQIWVVPVSSFIAVPNTDSSVDAATVVLVAPTGLNQKTTALYVAETITEIANAANA